MKRFVYLVLFFALFNLYGCNSTSSIAENGVEITFKTTEGDFTIFLFDQTPLHKIKMIELANDNFYDSILFHRVIKNFVIQAGDPETKKAEPGKLYGTAEAAGKINPEFIPQLLHVRGAIGAARESDVVNPERLSSGSHFYIVHGGAPVSEEDIYNLENRLGYKLDQKIIDNYKLYGGTPHLDGNYTIFGYISNGMDVVDKITTYKVDENNRPLKDVKIIETIITPLSEIETEEKYNNYAK